MKANRSQIAAILRVSLPTVDRYVGEGMPVLRRGKKGVPSSFDLAACIAWVRARDAKRLAPLPRTFEKQPKRNREELREILRRLWIPLGASMPWAVPEPEDVVDLREYEREVGLSHEDGEFLDWLMLGFPTLPPTEGEKMLRVSLPHAHIWRLTVGGLVETCGGDGLRLELGQEMRKLCGLPLGDELPEDGSGDEEGDPA